LFGKAFCIVCKKYGTSTVLCRSFWPVNDFWQTAAQNMPFDLAAFDARGHGIHQMLDPAPQLALRKQRAYCASGHYAPSPPVPDANAPRSSVLHGSGQKYCVHVNNDRMLSLFAADSDMDKHLRKLNFPPWKTRRNS